MSHMASKDELNKSPFAHCETAVAKVLESSAQDLLSLARIAGLDPASDFRDADLRGLDARGEDLTQFDFRGADLRGADLREARVCREALDGANLDGARLEKAKILERKLKPTLLVLEYDQSVLSVIRRILSASNYEAFVAGTKDEAMGIFNRERSSIDLVIIDIMVRNFSGIELVNEMLALKPGLRVLVTASGGTWLEQVRDFQEKNPKIPILIKPFSLRALTKEVGALLDR